MSRPLALVVAGSMFVVGMAVGLGWPQKLTPEAKGQVGVSFFGPTSAQLRQTRDTMFEDLARSNDLLERHSHVVRTVAELMAPSVVHIEAEKIGARGGVVEEAGSGVIVSVPRQPGQFFVLTNCHVITGAQLSDILIRLSDGRTLIGSRVWEDPATDIAVIRVDEQALVTARLGDSDVAEVGDFVIAAGSPFGLSHSMTFGIISARGRRNLELGDSRVQYQDFIQTDAAINPGNSGGPLVNLSGQVIGINTAIASNSGGNEGIGFSIPINMVMRVVSQLIDNGSVTRAFLGVTLDPSFDATAATRLGLPYPRGAHVVNVRPDSPAELVGLRGGDVIVEFDGVTIDDDSHLINVVGLTEINRSVPIIVWRDRQIVRLSVTVGPRSSYEAQASATE